MAQLDNAIEDGNSEILSNILDWGCCEYAYHGDLGQGGLLPIMYWAEMVQGDTEADRPIIIAATLSPSLALLCTNSHVVEG